MALAVSNNGGAMTATWTGSVGSVTGAAVDFKNFNDRTVTVGGTFDSAVITVQGSNDNSVWATMTCSDGTTAVFSAAGMKLLMEAPKYMRVNSASGGASSAVTAIIHATGGY